jgi:RNA polymerase sigma-70 factor (ECF subfamily)
MEAAGVQSGMSAAPETAMAQGPGPGPVPPFERIVAETSSDLYRLALRLTGDRGEADDVLQTTYVRAFEALRAGSFRGEASLRTWLYRILTHAAFDARRGGKRRDALAQAAAPSEAVESRSEASVELRELKDALLSLPEDQRAALALKELHGLKTKEVAEVLERSEGAVEQLLVRARAALKARFER